MTSAAYPPSLYMYLRDTNAHWMAEDPLMLGDLTPNTKELYEKIGFEEFSDVGVLVLESGKLPDSKVSAQIAGQMSNPWW